MRSGNFSVMSGATAWSLAAYAQQPDRVRRIGILAAGLESIAGQSLTGAFLTALPRKLSTAMQSSIDLDPDQRPFLTRR
jgi:hypothetical protein